MICYGLSVVLPKEGRESRPKLRRNKFAFRLAQFKGSQIKGFTGFYYVLRSVLVLVVVHSADEKAELSWNNYLDCDNSQIVGTC